MVTPETGLLIFVGASGRQYALSFYSSDVVGAFVTMSTNGVAGTGSTNFWVTPETVTLKDVSIATGQTVSTVGILFVNDVSTGSLVSWANCVNTLANRAIPNITIGPGKKFTIVQA